jgi:hypothetical protein
MRGRDRELLTQLICEVMPQPDPLKSQLNIIERNASWNAVVPLSSSYTSAVGHIVEAADEQGWLRELLVQLSAAYPGRPEFAEFLRLLEAPSEEPTTWDRSGEPTRSDRRRESTTMDGVLKDVDHAILVLEASRRRTRTFERLQGLGAGAVVATWLFLNYVVDVSFSGWIAIALVLGIGIFAKDTSDREKLIAAKIASLRLLVEKGHARILDGTQTKARLDAVRAADSTDELERAGLVQ